VSSRVKVILRAVVCDRATVEAEASAPDVAELRAAVLELTPPGHELAQLGVWGRIARKFTLRSQRPVEWVTWRSIF